MDEVYGGSHKREFLRKQRQGKRLTELNKPNIDSCNDSEKRYVLYGRREGRLLEV